VDGGTGFEEACIFGDDEEAVGVREGGKVAGSVPRDELNLRELRDGCGEFAMCRQEAGEARFGFAVSVAREAGENEAWMNLAAASESCEDGCTE
jgi:hypothetical protein